MEAYYPFVWLAVIVGAAILEAVTVQLVSIWMVVGNGQYLVRPFRQRSCDPGRT